MRASTVGALMAALSLVACGGSSKKEEPATDIATLAPGSASVGSWTRDPAKPADLAVGATAATNLVDGSADPFVARGFVQLARTYYVAPGSKTLELLIWQMTSAAAATSVYDELVQQPPVGSSVHSGQQWGPCSTAIGAACRIGSTGNGYWINTRKGAYHVEATVRPGTATAAEVEAMAAAVTARIP